MLVIRKYDSGLEAQPPPLLDIIGQLLRRTFVEVFVVSALDGLKPRLDVGSKLLECLHALRNASELLRAQLLNGLLDLFHTAHYLDCTYGGLLPFEATVVSFSDGTPGR